MIYIIRYATSKIGTSFLEEILALIIIFHPKILLNHLYRILYYGKPVTSVSNSTIKYSSKKKGQGNYMLQLINMYRLKMFLVGELTIS